MKGIKVKEIAENLGLSPATVKRALGNYGGISAKTKKRVLDEAKRLGYNQKIKSADIAIIIPHAPLFFWGKIKETLLEYAKKEKIDCRVFFFSSMKNEDDILRCIDKVIEADFPVLICSLPNTDLIREKINIVKNKSLVIMFEEYIKIEGTLYIGENQYEEGYSLANKYFSMNKDCSSVATFIVNQKNIQNRLEGFNKAVSENENVFIKHIVCNTESLTKITAPFFAREIEKIEQEVDCIFDFQGWTTLFSEAVSKLKSDKKIDIIGFDNKETAFLDNVKIISKQNINEQSRIAMEKAALYLREGKKPIENIIFVENIIINNKRRK